MTVQPTPIIASKIETLRINYDTCYLALHAVLNEEGWLNDVLHGVPLLEDDVVYLLRKHGADIIHVYTDWEDSAPRLVKLYLRRAERIAKATGYESSVQVKTRNQTLEGVEETDGMEISGLFIRIKDEKK